jgi:PAS domain S-box-containing protein
MGTMSEDSSSRHTIAEEYARALEAYLAGAGEAALAQAYDVGRKAVNVGIGVVEIAMVHHEALQQIAGNESASGPVMISLAAQFLAESLSPFEMTLRAYQANARLLGLSETLAVRNAEIDRAREQLRSILDATTALIYLKGADGVYLFVNEEFQRIFQRTRAEIIGKTPDDILPPALAEALHGNDGAILKSRTPQEIEETLPLGASAHTYLSLKFPLLDPNGVAYAVCSVATDITERKRASEALRRAKDAAEAANRELESFSYSVAHDLRAPLRSIDGFSHALLEEFADCLDAQGKKYLHFVRQSARHMAHLIDDLLALSRVTSAALEPERVDLTAMCREIAERLQAGDGDRRVAFTIGDGVTAMGDGHLLRVVLENLIGNSWKFTNRRSGAHIEFGAQLDGRPPVYFVRDDGAGFDMKHAGRLFRAFERLHSANEFEGTGIGLATVQRIIRRHGGRIWVESAVGRGSTFYFTLEPDAPV